MNKTLHITYSYNVVFTGDAYRFTLDGVDGETVDLELSEQQVKLMLARFDRAFFKRCKKEVIISAIDDAHNTAELEAIAQKYYLCDACSFADINLYGVKRILKVLVESLYKYPKLRSKLCFIGTHHTLGQLFERMEDGDEEVLKTFGLHYVCSSDNAKKLGHIIHNILSALISDHEGYIATAMCAFGLFDALLLDQNDFDGYAYLQVVSDLRKNEVSGFHPQGCNSVEFVVYHELGHLLDDMCGFYTSDPFTTYYNSLTTADIMSGLSRYALESPKEFIAEAFAEYMCNSTPRPIAQKTVELLDAAYHTSKNR
ncbi:MAG: hypothetical protein J1F66_03675 [Clostridiales bacterium]|nr:hypothetical protein [Clostridiales bacterium]